MTPTTFRQFPLRRAAALALVTVLASCGGFTAVSIGGTVTGLTGSGLAIANAGKTLAIPAGATSFSFPDQVDIRSTYAVTVVSQPARQTCTIFNSDGTAGAAPVTIINVACSANVYTLGGTVTGLKSAGLTINNGADQLVIDPAATTFTLPTRVADGSAYSVTILKQPIPQTCTIANGAGFMGGAPIATLAVTCQ